MSAQGFKEPPMTPEELGTFVKDTLEEYRGQDDSQALSLGHHRVNRALLEDAGCRSIGLAVAYAVTQVPAQEVIEAIAPKLFQAQGLSAPGLVKIIMDELQKGDPFQMLPEDYGVMRQQFAEFLIEHLSQKAGNLSTKPDEDKAKQVLSSVVIASRVIDLAATDSDNITSMQALEWFTTYMRMIKNLVWATPTSTASTASTPQPRKTIIERGVGTPRNVAESKVTALEPQTPGHKRSYSPAATPSATYYKSPKKETYSTPGGTVREKATLKESIHSAAKSVTPGATARHFNQMYQNPNPLLARQILGDPETPSRTSRQTRQPKLRFDDDTKPGPSKSEPLPRPDTPKRMDLVDTVMLDDDTEPEPRQPQSAKGKEKEHDDEAYLGDN